MISQEELRRVKACGLEVKRATEEYESLREELSARLSGGEDIESGDLSAKIREVMRQIPWKTVTEAAFARLTPHGKELLGWGEVHGETFAPVEVFSQLEALLRRQFAVPTGKYSMRIVERGGANGDEE